MIRLPNVDVKNNIINLSIKKKSVIPSGNKNIISPNIDKPDVESKPIQPIINSPIEFDKAKLDNIREGLNKQKQSRITKIDNDVFMAKSRKRNLRLGGR
jgi:hypothetical protein